LQAQTNLVYNGDFELYDTCPTGGSTPTDHQLERCLGWTIPTYATPDYLNACAGSGGGAGVPLNSCGYQTPRSGSGYCGLGLWQSGGWWIEYIQGHLTESLLAGRLYRCEFYISNSYCFSYTVDNIGVYFSQLPISRPDPFPINNVVPQISSPSGNYFIDSLNWIKVSAEFIASGSEQYLTIGRFVDTSNTNYLQLDTVGPDVAAYLYIDDISLSLIDSEISFPNVFSPNNDGINDEFIAHAVNLEMFNCKIFDRWGRLIVEIADVSEGWDGTFDGRNCTEGVYYYSCTGRGFDGINYTKSGIVQLVR